MIRLIVMNALCDLPPEKRNVFLERVVAVLERRRRFDDNDVGAAAQAALGLIQLAAIVKGEKKARHWGRAERGDNSRNTMTNSTGPRPPQTNAPAAAAGPGASLAFDSAGVASCHFVDQFPACPGAVTLRTCGKRLCGT
jgi:hypothetical protein